MKASGRRDQTHELRQMGNVDSILPFTTVVSNDSYPITRGSALLIVALSSVAFLGVRLEPMETIVILLIGGGIINLAVVRQTEGQRNGNAALSALTTGILIVAYSLVDGLGDSNTQLEEPTFDQVAANGWSEPIGDTNAYVL